MYHLRGAAFWHHSSPTTLPFVRLRLLSSVLCLRVSAPKCRCRLQWKPGKVFYQACASWLIQFFLYIFVKACWNIWKIWKRYVRVYANMFKVLQSLLCSFIFLWRARPDARGLPVWSCYELFSVWSFEVWLVLVGFGWGFSAFEARCDSNSDGHWPWGQIFVRDSMLFLSSASQIQSLLCIQLLFCKESPGKARLYSCMLLLILLFWFVVFVNSDAKHGPRAG